MEYKVILAVVVFIGSFAYIQTVFNTAYIESSMSLNYTTYWNGTEYTNLTARSVTQGAIPTPPSCSSGFVIIDGVLSCVGGYMIYWWDIMTFDTSIAWLNILIIIPLMVVFAYIIVKLLIELGKIVADLIPFT